MTITTSTSHSKYISSFRDRVYKITKQIPRGKVATYGQIARLVGSPGAGRAVGYLMKVNPDVPDTPCHRVVATDGSLTGYSGQEGLSGKKKMLTAEGVAFDGRRVNLSRSLWKR